MPKVLVSGAEGKVAKAVLPSLKDRFDLHLTDKISPSSNNKQYHQADLTHFEEVVPIMREMDAVLHLAIASVTEFNDSVSPNGLETFAEATINVNVRGTYHMFEAARRAGIKKFVYMSSLTTLMGGWKSDEHEHRYDRNTPPNPHDHYACTKLYGEHVAQLYSRMYNMSVIGLRIGQPYPIDERFDNAWKTNSRARGNFVAIEDIARAIACALATNIRFGIYNIVSSSDRQRVDLSDAREIGYTPSGYFSDNGFMIH